jgi:hypothetical protein
MEEFTEVVVKATGVTQLVPTEWLDHPILGAKFDPLPPEAEPELDTPAATPAAETAASPADQKTPATAPVDDKTPAAGDDKEN